MSGAKIIQAIEEAARGDFSRVTTHGQVWVRDGVDKASVWDAVVAVREQERKRLLGLLANHYWDSFEKDKNIIMKHINDVFSLTSAYRKEEA